MMNDNGEMMNDIEKLYSCGHFEYAIPFGGRIQIKCNKELKEDIPIKQIIPGVRYYVIYNEVIFPWSMETQFLAMVVAQGVQWGVHFSIENKGM